MRRPSKTEIDLRRRWLGIGLVAAMLALGLPGAGPRARAAAPPDLEDLVIVTEDLAVPPRPAGCDAVSVFDARAGTALHRGPRHVSPGRLAGTADLSLVVANAANSADGRTGFLTVMRGDPADPASWSTEAPVIGAPFAFHGGLALLPDENTLLVATVGETGRGAYPPPFGVRAYRVSGIAGGRVGPERGRIELDSPAAEILVAPGGDRVHIVTEGAEVVTVDAATLTEAEARIGMAPFGRLPVGVHGARIGVAHAALSGDGRYLITNRWDVPEINVADLNARRAWTVPLGAGVAVAGGVALNRGWVNAGLLAVHAVDEVRVYLFTPDGPLALLGRLPVARPRAEPGPFGPAAAIAWTGSGAHLVAATDRGAAEFVVIEVTEGGTRLRPTAELAACPERDNLPNDILTANGRITPPETPSCVCAVTHRRAPAAVVTEALANPSRFEGWRQPRDPGKPPGPANPRRTCLSMARPDLPFHVLWNRPLWRAGCP